jgi:hypothetical protein
MGADDVAITPSSRAVLVIGCHHDMLLHCRHAVMSSMTSRAARRDSPKILNHRKITPAVPRIGPLTTYWVASWLP